MMYELFLEIGYFVQRSPDLFLTRTLVVSQAQHQLTTKSLLSQSFKCIWHAKTHHSDFLARQFAQQMLRLAVVLLLVCELPIHDPPWPNVNPGFAKFNWEARKASYLCYNLSTKSRAGPIKLGIPAYGGRNCHQVGRQLRLWKPSNMRILEILHGLTARSQHQLRHA